MSNIYFIVSLLCIIILNCFFYKYLSKQREGFSFGDLNPFKLVDKILGKLLGGLIDKLLGSVPILRDIGKKVKKKEGLFEKIKETFYQLFISLLTIIFTPLAAIAVLYLAYQLMLFVIMNAHIMFQPNSLLKYIC
tara:strand:- start:3605 stop:4009 length:405 start_codon:yes stop_codon:yes gene_type:complete